KRVKNCGTNPSVFWMSALAAVAAGASARAADANAATPTIATITIFIIFIVFMTCLLVLSFLLPASCRLLSTERREQGRNVSFRRESPHIDARLARGREHHLGG